MKGLLLRRFDVILKFYGVELVGAKNRKKKKKKGTTEIRWGFAQESQTATLPASRAIETQSISHTQNQNSVERNEEHYSPDADCH